MGHISDPGLHVASTFFSVLNARRECQQFVPSRCLLVISHFSSGNEMHKKTTVASVDLPNLHNKRLVVEDAVEGAW